MTCLDYDVFLSHNSKDKPAVEYLAIRLEDEAGLKVFLDKWNLVPGDPWQEDLEKALAASRTVAVFLGPSGIGGWHNEEMRNALNQRVRDPERRVIPVLLPGTTKPQEAKLPVFLTRLTWVKFPKLDNDESFFRLVAGITGKPPGRGNRSGIGKLSTLSKPSISPGVEHAADKSSGPIFHGNFQGTYVEGDQTVIHKLEDRSIHVNAPISGSSLVTGDRNKVETGVEISQENFITLLHQMEALLPQSGLPPESQARVQSDLERAHKEVTRSNPDRETLLKRLGNLAEFLKNSATVAATVPQLVEMGQRALEWAKALF
jgi:hypothetical protein